MNGAQSLVTTLSNSGVTVCFANPGTSEMHFVAALDSVPEMRGVLCLFEGVATGAADGYGRMAASPASTNLHLGPGLANGLANLHDARRARTPIVNVVGDHATYHKRFDAPLESDIDALARSVSGWVRRSSRPGDVGPDAAAAVEAAMAGSGSIATLILPSDVSWEKGGQVAAARPRRPGAEAADAVVAGVAGALNSGEPCALLLGGPALVEPILSLAAGVASASGARLMCETFTPRVSRGSGRPMVEKLGYFAELALAQLDGVRHLVLVGATSPVAFFAYPGREGDLVPEGCQVHTLADVVAGEDVAASLEALADRIGLASWEPAPAGGHAPASGVLSPDAIGAVIGSRLPEGAVVVEEAITAGPSVWAGSTSSVPHDWVGHTGGAIGQGLPMATGAAVACPGRRVVSVEADGSAMYTIQALWTQAREGLDVTTVVVSNRAYAILQIEMHRVEASSLGSGTGPTAASLLELDRPSIDFVSLAKGLGVPAVAVSTVDELDRELARSIAEPGPALIEAQLPGRS